MKDVIKCRHVIVFQMSYITIDYENLVDSSDDDSSLEDDNVIDENNIPSPLRILHRMYSTLMELVYL